MRVKGGRVRALGVLERLDQLHILRDVPLGLSELAQKVILELLELDGEFVLLLDQDCLLLLEIRPLLRHNLVGMLGLGFRFPEDTIFQGLELFWF